LATATFPNLVLSRPFVANAGYFAPPILGFDYKYPVWSQDDVVNIAKGIWQNHVIYQVIIIIQSG